MPRKLGSFLRMALIGLVAISPFLTHLVLTAAGRPPVTAYGLILSQAVFTYFIVAARMGPSYRNAVLIACGSCSALAYFTSLASGLIFTSGFTHALAYFLLLTLFGSSLLPGREPIITFFARTIHGPPSAEVRRYTRNVTRAWCVFCCTQLMGSLFLILFAPLGWWSMFVNILNLPLIVSMLLTERITRPLWLADPPRERLADVLKMVDMVRSGLAARRSSAS